VAELAASRGVSRAQIALAWLLRNPVVAAPIVGVTRVEHLEDAFAALDVSLSDAEVERLESGYRPHSIAGFR
jgi:aryl-alcohol dehydrogenase (NADP+)